MGRRRDRYKRYSGFYVVCGCNEWVEDVGSVRIDLIYGNKLNRRIKQLIVKCRLKDEYNRCEK